MTKGIWDIDEWVDGVATLPIRSFYPTVVAKDTGLSLETVFDRLLVLTKEGKLKLQWEIRCPNYGCLRTIEIVSDPSTVIGKVVYCKICGEEIEVTTGNIFPFFAPTLDYKERMAQKKTGYSPVVFSMSRRLRSQIPCH